MDAGEAATGAGWGMGAERLAMTMLDLENVRETVLSRATGSDCALSASITNRERLPKNSPTATAYSASTSASTGSASPSSSSAA